LSIKKPRYIPNVASSYTLDVVIVVIQGSFLLSHRISF
jgi:hypothetical protein